MIDYREAGKRAYQMFQDTLIWNNDTSAPDFDSLPAHVQQAWMEVAVSAIRHYITRSLRFTSPIAREVLKLAGYDADALHKEHGDNLRLMITIVDGSTAPISQHDTSNFKNIEEGQRTMHPTIKKLIADFKALSEEKLRLSVNGLTRFGIASVADDGMRKLMVEQVAIAHQIIHLLEKGEAVSDYWKPVHSPLRIPTLEELSDMVYGESMKALRRMLEVSAVNMLNGTPIQFHFDAMTAVRFQKQIEGELQSGGYWFERSLGTQPSVVYTIGMFPKEPDKAVDNR